MKEWQHDEEDKYMYIKNNVKNGLNVSDKHNGAFQYVENVVYFSLY